jgi:flavin-dependent dehydrogenase
MKNPEKLKADVIIVGGGPAGLFAAYYLCENSDLDVLLIEKGSEALKRKCPIEIGRASCRERVS